MIRFVDRGSRGFTLIELMIVVSIIGILAAIAIPKFAGLLRKSQEGTTKGNLGALRSILSIYYADNEGIFPSSTYGDNKTVLSDSLIPKYAGKIPNSYPAAYHPPTDNVLCHSATCGHDGYGWMYYCYQPTNSDHGKIYVACSHTDTKGRLWNSY
ncbi:MAG: prepilin-type N-terminal cleavage/methylation domain-containing protein [Elusimicrobia bacterium]|nr:prepilin-type N-terminal cleavage/methylation domain-containing protein [Elusimicrobiota bacterium]